MIGTSDFTFISLALFTKEERKINMMIKFKMRPTMAPTPTRWHGIESFIIIKYIQRHLNVTWTRQRSVLWRFISLLASISSFTT